MADPAASVTGPRRIPPRWWTRAGRWCAGRRPAGDRGSSIIELAIVTPIVIVLLFTMVALGRYSQNKILVEQASAAAARAASLTSSPGQAGQAAQTAARDTLSGAGLACAQMSAAVDTSAFRPGGQVSVTVTCTADMSQLALIGVPGSSSLSYTSTAPLEAFRVIRGRFMNRSTKDPTMRRWRAADADADRGSAALWLAIVMVGLLAFATLVLDGGIALAARGQAADVAQQAARAGADALTPNTVFAGGGAAGLGAQEAAANTAAQNVLAAAGATGSVVVTAASVTVTATAVRHTAILSAVDINEVSGTASATAIPLLGTTTPGG